MGTKISDQKISRPKMLVRPVKEDDLEALCQIAIDVGPGFTSLPNDPGTIKTKISDSIFSFQKEIPKKISKEKELYLFVMEDLENHEIMATSAVEGNASALNVLYNYTIQKITQITYNEQQKENKEYQHSVLFFGNQYKDNTLFGALYVNPKIRGHGLGSFISRIRGLFLAEFPDLFTDIIASNIRGHFDKNGINLFWEEIGKKFFDMHFNEAYLQYATGNSKFVSDLAPKHPIYFEFLSEAVQKMIGKPHEATEAALHVLIKEGFCFRGGIDIMDGGPIIEAKRDSIKTVQHSRLAVIDEISVNMDEPSLFMMSNASMDFRACLGFVKKMNNENKKLAKVIIDATSAEILKLSKGDTLRYCLFR